MFNRVITIDAARPNATLQELIVGQYAALLLVIKGVPAEADKVIFTRTDPTNKSSAVAFEAKNVGYDRRIFIAAGFFASVQPYKYTICIFIEGEPYWSGSGIIRVQALPASAFPEQPATIDWAQVQNTPNTLTEYGISVKDELLTHKADLVDGKVSPSQLPSYVDDVIEFDDPAHFPANGERGKIYVSTSDNKTYRWSGTQYILIGETADGVTSKADKVKNARAGSFAGLDVDGNLTDSGKSASDFTPASHVNDSTIHIAKEERSTWNAKYSKPQTGIPKDDLTEDVQASLGKANSALQNHQSLDGYATTEAVNATLAGYKTKQTALDGRIAELEKTAFNGYVKTNPYEVGTFTTYGELYESHLPTMCVCFMDTMAHGKCLPTPSNADLGGQRAYDSYVDVENSSDHSTILIMNETEVGSRLVPVVEKGKSLSALLQMEAHEHARFHFTETGFTDGKPVVLITKKIFADNFGYSAGEYSWNSDGTVTFDGTLNPDGTVTIDGVMNSDGTITVEAL